MSNKEQQIWHAKRLINIAARATGISSRRIRAGLPATTSLRRSDRLIRASKVAWDAAIA